MCIFSSEDEEKPALPSLAKSNHPKISNGSVLIQLNYSESQGRYLEVRLQQLTYQLSLSGGEIGTMPCCSLAAICHMLTF